MVVSKTELGFLLDPIEKEFSIDLKDVIKVEVTESGPLIGLVPSAQDMIKITYKEGENQCILNFRTQHGVLLKKAIDDQVTVKALK